MEIIISVLVFMYIASIFGCKMYNMKIYSKDGLKKGLKVTKFDKIVSFIPIINTILSIDSLLGNTKYKNKIILSILLLISTNISIAQPLPANNGNKNGWHHNHHGAPLDKGVVIILIGSISYGVYKLNKK